MIIPKYLEIELATEKNLIKIIIYVVLRSDPQLIIILQ